jgi:autotransporter-associated beta strand protein
METTRPSPSAVPATPPFPAYSPSAPAPYTKDGTGILTLTGVNTYTGTTTVASGTLTLSGSGVIAATTP